MRMKRRMKGGPRNTITSLQVMVKSGSSPEAFPANHSLTPGSAEARTTTVTSGLRCSALCKSPGPVGFLLRMCLASSRWNSTRCLLTWKVKATPQGRLLFQLAPSTPRTVETESGLLGTPTETMNYTRPSMQKKPGCRLWRTPSAQQAGEGSLIERCVTKDGRPSVEGERAYDSATGNLVQVTLNRQVKMWPTPRSGKVTDENEESWRRRQQEGGVATPPLSLAARMWPTATASDARIHKNDTVRHASLGAKVHRTRDASGPTKASGSLNPAWVSVLMGFPPHWTDMED